VTELNALINVLRTVKARDLIMPDDHNIQTQALEKISEILEDLSAGGGVVKVEKTFNGAFGLDEEVVSDTPALNRVFLWFYAILETTDTNLVLEPYFNDKALNTFFLADVGYYAWQEVNRGVSYKADDSYSSSGNSGYGWRLGYKISLKATSAGTGSGKLILYYAVI
jgi:hypothetical protein